MTNDRLPFSVRRAARVIAFVPAVLVLAAGSPAFATAPEEWGPEPDVSALHAILILVVIPLGLVVLITFLALVPDFIRGQRYEPGRPWRNQPEWFGGPQKGLEAADEAEPEALEQSHGGRGGASAHW